MRYIEEEIFYPGVKGEVESDMLDEVCVEHDGAKVLIAELMAGSPDDDFYDAKVKVLSEEIESCSVAMQPWSARKVPSNQAVIAFGWERLVLVQRSAQRTDFSLGW